MLEIDELEKVTGGLVPGIHSEEEEALLRECEEMNESDDDSSFLKKVENPHSKRYKGGLSKK